MKNKELKGKRGITLIALVVTIVVLLILAGISINLIFSNDGIIKKVSDAADAQKEAAEKDQQAINDLGAELNRIIEENRGTSGGSGTGSEGSATIPNGLDIGSTVSYCPSGTYNWQAKYCSSTKSETTGDVTLSSAADGSFNITSWKVLSIDKATGTVELVPSSQTTGTVYLGQAQGYNNGVKLLNDACSNLYGNSTKGISARSINMDDIENYMTETAKEKVNNSGYGTPASTPYTTAKKYPVIYAQEKLAVINGKSNGNTGLGLSDAPNNFIERTENGATKGFLEATDSIQPYQLYWQTGGTFMTNAFKDYKKQDKTTANYYSLIMPNGSESAYFLASRCIYVSSSSVEFATRSMASGQLARGNPYDSSGVSTFGSENKKLFPVITLNSSLIIGDETNFRVQ